MSYYDTAPLKKTLERLVDFDRINDLKTRLSASARSASPRAISATSTISKFRKLSKKIGPEHIMASGALPPGFPSVVIEGEHYWDGGISSNTPLDFVLDEEINRDLLIFQVDLFSARGDAAGRRCWRPPSARRTSAIPAAPAMNTDKNKQIHNARMAVRDLISKLPDYLKNDPSVELLRKAPKENTVTVVHLIYKSKNYETTSKDYDFSHVAMVEHWGAGVRDVHLSMRHKEWLERPQSGETMVTYDLTGDRTQAPAEQIGANKNGYVDRQDRRRDRLDQRHRTGDCARASPAPAPTSSSTAWACRPTSRRSVPASRPTSRSRRCIRRPT